MSSIYGLFHTTTTAFADEDRTIGVFANASEANQVLDRLRSKPGFRDAPAGFGVDEYKLDHDHWPEGFAWADDRTEVLADETLDCLAIDPDPNVFLLEHRRVTGNH